MRELSRAMLLCGASALAAMTATAAQAAPTETAYPAVHAFDIPSKPLLAALADFTATTGVQVIRPGAQKLSGNAPAVVGRKTTGEALRKLLAGSGLVFRPVGPRTIALQGVNDLQTVQFAGEATYLEQIDVTGRAGTGGRRSEGGDGKIDITAEDFARKQPQDLKQVFRGEPGIQVGGSNPINQKVYVHGVEENNLAVSIDGAAQNNKVFHHNATTVIDPQLLKTARVDAGVAPADAGFGALAGSIAYETKDVGDLLGETADPSPIVSKDPVAPYEPKWFGGFAKSTFNTNGNIWGNSFALYGKKNGFEALGFFNIARGNSFDRGSKYKGPPKGPGQYTGDRVGGTATDLTSGLAKFAYEADSGHRFEFSHERVVDDAIRPYRANAGGIDIPGRIEPRFRKYDLKRQNSVFTYTDTSPEGWWDPKVVFAYSKTKVEIPTFEPVGFTPGGERIFGYARDAIGETATYTGRAENKFSFQGGNVVAGADFKRDRAHIDYAPVGFDLPARELSTVAGVYAQARLEPIERARLSFGGRGDYQWFEGVNDTKGAEKDHGGLSGNVSGEYDLIPDWLTAKAGYSHVWAGIPLAENFVFNHLWSYGGSALVPLDRLKAVTSDNVNAGLVLKHNGFTVEGSVFRTAIDNARLAAYSTTDINGGYSDFGASRTRDLVSKGFELGAGYAWETGFVKAKWAHIKVDIDGSRADSDTGVYLATPVGDIITLTAAHTFAPYDVTIGADAEIAPKYKRVAVDSATGRRKPYPAYDVYNAFLEYKPKFAQFETTFRVDVKNILNKTYSSRASYGSEFGNVTPLFEPGRSVILSAAVKF